MGTRRTTPKTRVETDNPPVRDPQKDSTQGPESGPSGDVVVDANAPGPFTVPDQAPLGAHNAKTRKAQQQQAKAQTTLENEKKDRAVKVTATRRGYVGNRIREEGETFIIQLEAGEKMPSWVEAASPDVPTSSVAHSAEAKPEFVDADGTGHKIDGNDVL
jgi:hypothetical protein